jgi:phosphatidylserine decarboxylase
MTAGGAHDPVFRERPTAPIAPEGWPFVVPLLLATAGIAAFAPLWLAALAAGLTVFVVAFFRNPSRPLPGGESTVVAPADGRVLCVDEIEHPRLGKGLRIGIFLSVFDVHVNRAPLAGRVVAIEHSGSLFLAAWNPRGERENVQLMMTLELAGGRRIAVTQITGLIARRIVCHAQVGERIERGARYGLIRFGSRTDVWLPPGSRAAVKPGDRVRGGATVLAELGPTP